MSYRSMKLELMSFIPEINAVQAGIRLNRSYQHLLALHPWSFIKAESLTKLVGQYTTGTATATLGSDTVTGIGTAWDATFVGRFLKIASSVVSYEIIAFTAPQTLTLESDFNEASVVSHAYVIYKHRYDKPSDCADIKSIRYDLNLPQVSKVYIDSMDPNRESSGQPNYWMNFTDSVWEVWPVPDTDYTVRLWYNRSIPNMSAETDSPIIPDSVILAHAKQEACLYLATTPGIDANVAKHYLSVYTMMTQDAGPTSFRALWQSAMEEDTRKLSLPKTVIAVGPDYPDNNDYLMRHDVGDPRRP
jgi:hypothetical protein